MKKMFFLFLLAAFNAEAEECLAVNGERSEIAFEIEQAGTAFKGNFETAGGTVCVSDGAVTRIDAWLDPASADTGLPELDRALAGEEFFAVKKFPRVTFKSDAIEKTGDGFVAHGTLTMKGKSKPFDLPFTLEKRDSNYSASGETQVRRLEFGIGTGEWSDVEWLSDEVTIRYSIVAG
ncbi:MAG TPA: YceI family protein [Gammaproteobacteria bacterium]